MVAIIYILVIKIFMIKIKKLSEENWCLSSYIYTSLL